MQRTAIVVSAALAGLSIISPARAQTSAGGIFKPWPVGQHVQAEGNALFENSGHTKKADEDFQLSTYSSAGRWRLSDTHKLNPTIGYDINYLNLDSNSPALPNQLTDQTIGFGTPIYQFQPSGWFIAASGAYGYAGDAPYSQGDGWYGKATLILGKELGKESNIIFGLDYDGNRSFAPDIPLPGFAYTFRYDPTILLVVGFPYASIEWTPQFLPHFKLDAGYAIPDSFDAEIEYEVINHVKLIANYQTFTQPFHVDDIGGHDRLFFESRRVEAGVKVEPVEAVGLFATIGYAFGQEFDVGFDVRNLDEVRKISDEAFLRVGVDVKF